MTFLNDKQTNNGNKQKQNKQKSNNKDLPIPGDPMIHEPVGFLGFFSCCILLSQIFFHIGYIFDADVSS